MSVWATAWAWRVPDLASRERLVLVALADSADDNDVVLVPEDVLRSLTGLSSVELRQVVQALVVAELVSEVCLRVAGEGSQQRLWVSCRLEAPDELSVRRGRSLAGSGAVAR